MVLGLLLLGCGRDEPPEPVDPIGELVWVAAGGFDPSCYLEMYRDGERIEFRACDHRAVGTLTFAGVSAWDDAVASVDPAAVPDFRVCAPADGIDICFDLEGNGDLFAMCYCALDPPPPEAVEFDAYFGGLVIALHECESSEHIVIDLCET
jgi:hypothetical protein